MVNYTYTGQMDYCSNGSIGLPYEEFTTLSLRNLIKWNVNPARTVNAIFYSTESTLILTCERNPPMAGPITRAIAREDVTYNMMSAISIH
jgi:hypothetical protein